MSLDAELDQWRDQWQSAPDWIPPDLQQRVDRQTRLMRWMLAADLAVTIVIGGGVIAWTARSAESDVFFLAAVTWVFLAAAWTVALFANRGKWSPASLDTHAFVDLSIDRCRARIAVIDFGAVIYMIEIAFSLASIYHHSPQHAASFWAWLWFSAPLIDAIWIGTALFLASLLWYRHRKVAELRWLRRYGESLRSLG